MRRFVLFAFSSVRRGSASSVAVVLLAAGLTGLPSPTSAATANAPASANPTPVPRQTVHPGSAGPDETEAASHWAMPTVTFPAPSAATVAVSATALSTSGVVRVAAPAALGTLGLPKDRAHRKMPPGLQGPASHAPVWAADSTATPPGRVRVETLGQPARNALGGAPMVFTVNRADSAAKAGPVAVSVDYSGFRDAYGGNYGERLQLVRYPACVLLLPEDPACSTGTPIADQTNDVNATTLTAVIDAAPDLAPATTSATPATATPSPTPTDATPAGSGGGSVFVVTAGASSPYGTYVASPLAGSAAWSVGLQSGSLNYSYPISAPAPMGGAAPRVALDYDSGSVDGRTSATNPQASSVGIGWDYQPGFVEREYDSCDRRGGGNPDLCYVPGRAQNITLSLNGQTQHLIKDATTGIWRMQDDPGWKILDDTGAGSADKNGEYWKLFSPDGTIYYFGRNIGRVGSAATNSVWTVPVFNYDSACPASGVTSCIKAWRWNLDYVVDRNGNATSYYYAQETNAYKVRNVSPAKAYVRGGHLTKIEYGYRDTNPLTTDPVDRITFTSVGRCTANSNGANVACPTLGPANATSYPDVPTDLVCVTGSTTCTKTSPSFFSTTMLQTITTSVLSSPGTYSGIDRYDIQQNFPDPDGTGPESPSLWMKQVMHTGIAGGGSVPLPQMILYGTALPNRFTSAPGVSVVNQYRVVQIFNETGGDLAVNYGQPDPCNSAMIASSDHSGNTYDCFPVYWAAAGGSDWAVDFFNKYLITRVGQYVNYANEVPHTTAPGTVATAEPIVTDYDYQGGAAWHKCEFELNEKISDTWNEYRGYKTVVVTENRVDNTVINPTPSLARSVTTHTFFRGMYGMPYLPGHTPATNGDTVTTADLGTWNDSPSLRGREAETITKTAGGTMLRRIDRSYWASTTATAQPVGTDPAETANQVLPKYTYIDDKKADGTMRRHHFADVHYAATPATDIRNGALITHVDDGDADAADPGAVCTGMTYVTSSGWLLVPQAKTTYAGHASGQNCTTSAQLLGKTLYYYDGQQPNNAAAPTRGDLSCVRVFLDASATGDCPATASPSAGVADTYSTYDAYGRALTATDPNAHTTTTEYTPTGGRPTSVKVTSPDVSEPPATTTHNLVTTSTLDLRGMVTQNTDANGNVSKMVYDALGRLTKAYAPTEAALATDTPTFIASYNASRSTWSTVETKTLIDIVGSPATAQYRDTWTYLDGWLRPREVHTIPSSGSGHLTVQTRYNDVGEVSATTSPYAGASAPGAGIDYTDPSRVPLEMRYRTDPLHRQNVAGRNVLGAKSWGRTVTTFNADTVIVTPPSPAPVVANQVDVWGRALVSTETSQVAGDTSTSSSSYRYDPLGRLTKVTDAAGKFSNYTYDVGGRRTSTTDADAGTSTAAYDAVGNVVQTFDARGVEVDTTYDEINRPLTVSSNTAIAAPTGFTGLAAGGLVTYRYDRGAAGNLGLPYSTTVTDLNGASWTTKVTGYDADSRPLGTAFELPPVSGQPASTYTYATHYNNAGEVTAVDYPAVGGLAAETVTTAYDVGAGDTGLPMSLSGLGALSLTNAYSDIDQLASRTYGASGVGQAVRTYAYEDPLRRLSEVVTTANSGPTAEVQRDAFSYDNANNPTQVSDKTTSGGGQQTCFTYDGLDRLVKAWTETTNCASWTATTADGPAGFNQQYSYNPNGTPAQRIDSGTATSYALTDPSHPHAVTGFGANSYSYDAAGQQVSRTVGATTTTQLWDALGHLYQSGPVGGGSLTSYVSALDGSRIARENPDGSTTIWLGGDELTLNAGSGASANRYYTFGGATVAMRGAAGLTWLMSDVQNSRQLSVDASTGAATRAYYTPYGAQRAGSASLPTSQSFLGRVLDASGLLQDGARYYDPAIGQFLSTDPLINVGTSQSLNPYGYAGNNPATFADPSGLWFPSNGGLVEPAQSYPMNGDKDGYSLGDLGGDIADGGVAFVNGVKDAVVNGTVSTVNSTIDMVGGVLQGEAHVGLPDNLAAYGPGDPLAGHSAPHIPAVPDFPLPTKFHGRPSILKGAKIAGVVVGSVVGPKALGKLGAALKVTKAAGTAGSGPIAGVLEASASSKSVGAINAWNGKGGVEFVFDPEAGTFAMGRPASRGGLKGSPHEQLAQAIGADSDTVVGGVLSRGANGNLAWNEQSGHFWQNWTPAIRQQFVATLRSYGVNIDG